MHVTPRKGRNVKSTLGAGADKAEAQANKAGSAIQSDDTVNGAKGAKGAKLSLSLYYGKTTAGRLVEVGLYVGR